MLVVMVAALGACADGGGDMGGGGDAALEEAGPPQGFVVRLDRTDRDPTNFNVELVDGALHLRTGPSGILYRADQAVAGGDYTVSATFMEVSAPFGHREGFGLFIGGQDLTGSSQSYTYFLVRSDGKYLVKRRSGSTTISITDDWVVADAVGRAGEDGGDVVNDLAVTVTSDRVTFRCNGVELLDVPSSDMVTHGLVGLRVNHNLEVQVRDMRVER
jgi:hypothetical protein